MRLEVRNSVEAGEIAQDPEASGLTSHGSRTAEDYGRYPAARAWVEQDCAVSRRGCRSVSSFDRDYAQRKSIQSANGNR